MILSSFDLSTNLLFHGARSAIWTRCEQLVISMETSWIVRGSWRDMPRSVSICSTLDGLPCNSSAGWADASISSIVCFCQPSSCAFSTGTSICFISWDAPLPRRGPQWGTWCSPRNRWCWDEWLPVCFTPKS